MSAPAGEAPAVRPHKTLFPGIAAVLLAALAGLLTLALGMQGTMSAGAVAAVPIAALITGATMWDTRAGLCVAAFAIGPFGIVQTELAGVTINLPEILILSLVAKETLVFVVRRERPVRFVPWVLFALFLATALLAVATGLRRGNPPARVLQDFRQFTEYILLYVLVVHRVTSPGQVRAVLTCYVAGGSLLALHGILQRFLPVGVPGVQVLHDLIVYGSTRSGSFYGATPLGALMVLSVAAALAVMASTPRLALKAGMGAAAAVCTVALVFTNTRASWIALALALVTLFVMVRKRRAVVAVALAGAVLFTVTLGPQVMERLSTLQVSRSERSLLQRVRYYETAWHIFRAQPVLGLGWGSYYDASEILANRRYVPSIEARGAFDYNEVTVHSAYLQMLVKAGLPGAMALVLILLDWLRKLPRARHAAADLRDLAAGLGAGLVGYLFHCAFENFFQWPVMAQTFWLLFGLSTLTLVWARECDEAADTQGEAQ